MSTAWAVQDVSAKAVAISAIFVNFIGLSIGTAHKKGLGLGME